MSPKDADGMANNVDPDQTAPRGIYTVCPGPSVRKLRRIIKVVCYTNEFFALNFHTIYLNQKLV